MAVTARRVSYTMATSVAWKELRGFSLLGYEIQKKILRGLENRLGDVPDESKIAFGGGFGQGYPSKSFLDLFWTRF